MVKTQPGQQPETTNSKSKTIDSINRVCFGYRAKILKNGTDPKIVIIG